MVRAHPGAISFAGLARFYAKEEAKKKLPNLAGFFFYIYLQNLPKQNIYRTYKNKIFTELTKPKIDFFAKTKQNEDSNLETENLNINNKMRIRTWKVKIKYHQFSSELSDLA